MLRLAFPISGVRLALHGALLGEDEPDVDGDILELVRTIVGSRIPVVGTLDLHANITSRMMQNADMLVAYHTSPHVDIFETGEKAAKFLEMIITGNESPFGCWTKIPMIIPSEKHDSFASPLKDLFDLVHEAEEDKSIWSTSLCIVQPWLDIPEHGWGVMCWGTDVERLKKCVERIALKSWGMRKSFDVERIGPRQAVEESLSFKAKPVIIADGADATNSGAPGDSTVLLKEFLRQSPEGKVFLTMVDPEIVSEALVVGVGNQLRGRMGGKRDSVFSSPVEIEGEVRIIFCGKYTLSGHGGKNLRVNTGRTVVLKCGMIHIVVSEFPGIGSHPAVYRSVGLELEEAQVVVVKSPAGFRADYASLAAKMILADTSGLASPHYQDLPYRTDRTRFYPWQYDFKWMPRIEMK